VAVAVLLLLLSLLLQSSALVSSAAARSSSVISACLFSGSTQQPHQRVPGGGRQGRWCSGTNGRLAVDTIIMPKLGLQPMPSARRAAPSGREEVLQEQ
jgi:hypothetical protein